MHIGKEDEETREEPRPTKAPIIIVIPKREPERVPAYAPGRGPGEFGSPAPPMRHMEMEFQDFSGKIECPKKGCDRILKEKDTEAGLELVCSKHGVFPWQEIFKVKAGK